MTFMHFDAHTAAAGVITPYLAGTALSPVTAYGVENAGSTAECGWVFCTINFTDTSPTVNYVPGNITRYEWDFGAPSYSNRPEEEWYANKAYTETFWLRATLESGTSPDFGSTVGTWYDISPGANSPGPFYYWSNSTTATTITGTLKIEIARDNGGAAGTVVATGYYAGSCQVRASTGGGGGCFTGGMLVLMADGTEKPIRDIVEGEMVVSIDDNEKFVPAKVNHVMAPRTTTVYEVKLSNGKVIETTAEHPFRTVDGKWVNIDPEATYQGTLGGPNVKPDVDGKMQYGTRLYGFETNAKVVEIKNTGRQETVYHLSRVGEHHNYFVEGMCVHNLDEGREVKV